MPDHEQLPDGLGERSPEWHLEHFIEFTRCKLSVREPSPHLTMVGHMAREQELQERVWRLGCYAIPYSLPVGQTMWSAFNAEAALGNPQKVQDWVTQNWTAVLKGTRRERRCVRSVAKYNDCLQSYIEFVRTGFPRLQKLDPASPDYYEHVWDEVNRVRYFGRYISIRVIEGLRRFCNIPAELPDIRALGAWSPRRCLVYLAPDRAEDLLTDSKECNARTEEIARHYAEVVRQAVPGCTYYIYAAMLCEYRDAFEDRRQYVGWTIDQEPLLHEKSKVHFGSLLDSALFWKTRSELFPHEALCERSGNSRWNGTRWDLTPILRDHGYVWSDLKYDYQRTTDFSNPVSRRS